ncbi:DAHP synthetase [Melampsora americana]|nr:DAHP synthetase [Melampsora americana]
MSNWNPSSWRNKPIQQNVLYPSQTSHKLNHVKQKLNTLPGLVTPQEIVKLKKQLISVSRGEAFILQGGDCAELFKNCEPDQISSRIKLILMMSLIIIWGSRLPVIRIGRIAGQFAKPRSNLTERINGQEYPSFRGDNVNGYSLDERVPDPERLLMAYYHSAATINHIRSLLASGYADLHRPSAWSFAHVRSPELQSKYEEIIERLNDSLSFMKTVGASHHHPTLESGVGQGSLNTVDIWTSHEALMLEYEEALTRSDEPEQVHRTRNLNLNPTNPSSDHRLKRETTNSNESKPKKWLPKLNHYDLSAHLLWVGDRTRQLDHAHLEFLRGISNPIGIKLGPNLKMDELMEILNLINPSYEQGKVILICRFGVQEIERCLPDCIKAVLHSAHRHSIFICDPMHGNTKNVEGESGVKTRYTEDIINEIRMSFKIHHEHGSKLGGVHLEMTGELDEEGYSVTECLGGSMGLTTENLSLSYKTYCDPRLNYEQSLDIAFMISNEFKLIHQDKLKSPLAIYDLLLSPTF